METFLMGCALTFVIIFVTFFGGAACAFIHEELEDAKYRNKPKFIFIWVVMTAGMLGTCYYGYTFISEQYNNTHQIRVNGEIFTDSK